MSIYKLYPYSTNVLKVLGCDIPKDELVFGLEMESMKTDTHPLVDTGVGVWKEDNSCWGEFVTQPMSYEDMVEWAQTAPLHTIKPSKACGMHVHINRGAITQKESCRLALLLSDEKHTKDIDYMAGRPANRYCKKVKAHDMNQSRYTAVNLTNFEETKNTVELRLFSSTNSNKELLARLLWVKKLVEFVKSDCASENYADFLKWEKAKYSEQSKLNVPKVIGKFLTKPRKVCNPLDFLSLEEGFTSPVSNWELLVHSMRVLLVVFLCMGITVTPLIVYITGSRMIDHYTHNDY